MKAALVCDPWKRSWKSHSVCVEQYIKEGKVGLTAYFVSVSVEYIMIDKHIMNKYMLTEEK